MCDYSLHAVKTRDAKVGDKLIVTRFVRALTSGLASADDLECAVCLKPGTEIVVDLGYRLWAQRKRVAHFHQKKVIMSPAGSPCEHRDAVEYVDGSIHRIVDLKIGTEIAVLQMPAEKKPVVIETIGDALETV